MSTHADEIEEANDSAIRRARVNALFAATTMAARLAATDGDSLREKATAESAKVISLPRVEDSRREDANAVG